MCHFHPLWCYRNKTFVYISWRDELLAAMSELVSKLNQWLEVQGCMKVAKESLQDCHQQMTLVKEAEAYGPSAQHPLYTLAARYAKHCCARDAQDKARAALREKIEDCEKHLNLHKVIDSLSEEFFMLITLKLWWTWTVRFYRTLILLLVLFWQISVPSFVLFSSKINH